MFVVVVDQALQYHYHAKQFLICDDFFNGKTCEEHDVRCSQLYKGSLVDSLGQRPDTKPKLLQGDSNSRHSLVIYSFLFEFKSIGLLPSSLPDCKISLSSCVSIFPLTAD